MRSVLFAILISSPAVLMAQSAPNSNSREFVEAFVVTERARLIDRIQKQGNQFDQPRELEKVQQRHMKLFGTSLPAPMLAEFDRAARETVPLTPDQLNQLGPDAKRSPTELSPDLYLRAAKLKLLEEMREDGDRFDLSKELSKINERYEKSFGQPMPREMYDTVLRSADSARSVYQTIRADAANALDPTKPAGSKTAKTATGKSAPARTHKVVNGVRYPSDVPDWFAAADQDRDGQVGLYEWDRSRFEEFVRWDLNGDGLLEPREVLRVNRQAAPSANAQNPSLK